MQTIISYTIEKDFLMQSVKKRLPQLDPLVAFEAAARHSSFALAAKELNITAPAISQQIRNLEISLGVCLFERGHRSVQLTDRGKVFQNSVTIALTHLANATDELRIEDEPNQIVIATDMSIPTLWLFPKLQQFDSEFPGGSINLVTTDIQSDLLATNFHLAIVHGQGDWVGYESKLLFKEEVFPVCSPQYLRENPDVAILENLPNARLLDLEYEHWNWMNWAIWLTEKNISPPKSQRKLRMSNYPMLIDAACRGYGVALGWKHLVDQHIENGTLTRLSTASVNTKYGYYLIWPHNFKMEAMAHKFHQWCMKQAC